MKKKNKTAATLVADSDDEGYKANHTHTHTHTHMSATEQKFSYYSGGRRQHPIVEEAFSVHILWYV